MSPDRTASRVAQLISKMADRLEKEKAFPSTENLKQFNALVAEYSKLLSTINEKTDKSQDSQGFLIRGRKGAYERLLEE
jgi:hypothetical protein